MAKTNFGGIYEEGTPQKYVQTLVPIDYGHYHDRYTEMVNEELEKLYKGKQMKAVELGASYGNTTLSYRCGYNWEKSVDVWLNEEKPLEYKWDFHIVAMDLSENALGFGKRRGIFDTTIAHDFSVPFTPELGKHMEQADFMTSIMTTFYIPTERWYEAVFKFLSDRSKPKLLAYNMMMAFDDRNWTPEVLFNGVQKWSCRRSFNKHRNFTELEQSTHHGNKEAWTMTYFVHFDAIEPPAGGH
mmetsp:Transcript_8045/g.16024  ORF Transcript_8045/g.16024 Transcript_8045/m.16024 type:complete len:242 (+) Transcript_8045:79-804(+)|eukprot:CAMPEP_0181313690 /NCGR_PEP_ID=MMETSP1101-20121128/14387_1 /TAXON_ID=46948 /ORGANISM="Rhodomonas abbreviata, Strain Caron Lab Isolate" /LENGTH=241 /DNA_ID=CAMNT_0023420669 /DNA_START=76 /DNA_END=801 /DNA_ORIENTATION=-